MKKRILFSLLLAACLLPLDGCAMLLERSYGGVEPYADRYWDPGAEDTLRAENYQELVNSLLMLVEQRAEEGVIRSYGEVDTSTQAWAAAREVRTDTLLGSYLLDGMTCTFESGGAYCTLTYHMTYRADTEDLDSVMTISDTQSLTDLLRLAVREEHPRLTAQFVYGIPREDVTAAVEALWQELVSDGAAEEPPEEGPEERPPAEQPPESTAPEDPEGAAPAEGGQDDASPCPWTIRCYPEGDTAELVEIDLAEP